MVISVKFEALLAKKIVEIGCPHRLRVLMFDDLVFNV